MVSPFHKRESKLMKYRYLSEVVRYANGNVMAFDQHGNQFEQFQGAYEDVQKDIMANAPSHCRFFKGGYGTGLTEVSRGNW